MRSGWYLVVFERELTGDITPVDVDSTPVVLTADGDRIRAFDAICPHQGANLGYGGRLDAQAIICPFHGKRITLGTQAGTEYCVREYPVLGYGGMVFVRFTEQHENGLEELLEELASDHVFVPFNRAPFAAAGKLVIENAFDAGHFRPVHGIRNAPKFSVCRTGAGSFVAQGRLHVLPTPWYQGQPGQVLEVPFRACAFSPHLVFSHIGGDDPYWIITGTTPTADGCLVRQALAIPRSGTAPPNADRITYLARASKEGMEKDRIIWEHLHQPANPRYGPEDAALLAFREFCADLELSG
jgi:3-ketosteroid 9alpha-monooxygenase subunit A